MSSMRACTYLLITHMHAYYIVSCKTPLVKCGMQAQFFYCDELSRPLQKQ